MPLKYGPRNDDYIEVERSPEVEHYLAERRALKRRRNIGALFVVSILGPVAAGACYYSGLFSIDIHGAGLNVGPWTADQPARVGYLYGVASVLALLILLRMALYVMEYQPHLIKVSERNIHRTNRSTTRGNKPVAKPPSRR